MIGTTGTAHVPQLILSMPIICVNLKVICLGKKRKRIMEMIYVK